VSIFSKLVFEWAIAVASPRRSATGKRLAAICRDAGMPSRATIFRWIARYKEFHDEYTLD
jgi:hypothetical protein